MDEKALDRYQGLLVEIKHRTATIDDILKKKVPIRAKIAEELCYLQLRMICELIAIGCLIIHGDVSARKQDLFRSYKADWIMSRLELLHPRFYPQPLEHQDRVGPHPEWVHKTDGFLARKDLVKLIRLAGERVHRGTARNVLKNDRPLEFADIRRWHDMVVALLTRHIIISPDEETIFYFVMNNGKNEVARNVFKRT